MPRPPVPQGCAVVEKDHWGEFARFIGPSSPELKDVERTEFLLARRAMQIADALLSNTSPEAWMLADYADMKRQLVTVESAHHHSAVPGLMAGHIVRPEELAQRHAQ